MHMSARSPEFMLEAAARFRDFACETGIALYRDRFLRGARDLELEAVGYASSGAVARALRDMRAKRRIEELPC
jgi:hypothetical protein